MSTCSILSGDDFKRLGDAREAARLVSGATPNEWIDAGWRVEAAVAAAMVKLFDAYAKVSRWREWRDKGAERAYGIASATTSLLASERATRGESEINVETDRANCGVDAVRDAIRAAELRPYLDPAVFDALVDPWESATGVVLRRPVAEATLR